MPQPQQLTRLLELEREEERRFVSLLTDAELAAEGTLEQPSPKDYFGHAIGAKQRMHEALVSARNGTTPDPSHDRAALFAANAGRPFEAMDREAEAVGEALLADVGRLDAEALSSSPGWVDEDTLADEIVQQCVTHALVHLYEPLCDRGAVDQAVQVQKRFLDSLPDDISARQRSRGLYNLACLCVRSGSEDDALAVLRRAIELRPSLLEHARDDAELEQVRDRLG